MYFSLASYSYEKPSVIFAMRAILRGALFRHRLQGRYNTRGRLEQPRYLE